MRENTRRNNTICRLRRRGVSFSSIAKRFAITKQRAWQIYARVTAVKPR
jgi:hypothetical protein